MSKRRKLIFVLGIIFVTGFFLMNFIRQQYVVPILMYHSVNPRAQPRDRLVVSPQTFQRQMRFLKKYNYNVLPLETLATLIKEKRKIPPKTVAITLDDGYKDNYLYAFPVLKKYNLCATIFVIINEIGRGQSDRLSWDEIKAMQHSGLITFGSHALGPDPLTKIYSSHLVKFNLGQYFKEQIFDSKRILEEKLGTRINAFSYPEGRFNEAIRKLVIDAGYKLAVATNPGKSYPDDDVFALKRLRISSTSGNLFVFWIETGGYYNFIREHRHK